MAQDQITETQSDGHETLRRPTVISFESARLEHSTRQPGALTTETTLRPGSVAEQVADLEKEVERLRQAERALVESNDALTLLSETANELLSSDRPQEVIGSLFQKLSARLGLEAYFNYLVVEGTGKLRLNSYTGIPPEVAREIEWLEFGQAVCGCVARDGCRMIAEDVQNSDDVRTDLVRSFGITAYACHPLKARGKVIGTFSFGTSRKPEFESHELALMQAVCDQVSMAMDRILLIAELRQREAAQRLLADASAVLGSSLDHEGTLLDFSRLLVDNLADWCVVDLMEGDGTVRRLVAVRDDPEGTGLTRELGRCDLLARDEVDTLERVLSDGQAELFADLTGGTLERFSGNAREQKRLADLGAHSAMVLPLNGRPGSLGTITLIAAGSARRYGVDDLALAKELAFRAAMSIENARLYLGARESARLRDEFLSVAAHELKTPITSLKGFAQTLLRQIDKGQAIEDLRSQRTLRVIDDQSGKLANLISQLLDVSRVESGVLTLERRSIELGELVKGTADTVQVTLPHHQIEVRIHEPVWTTADPLRLEQAVRNLLDNAVKYSPRDSRVDVDVWSPEMGTVKIAIRDRGPGIPAEHREHVFNRFFQVQSTSYFGGMGLGLYLSRHIVELHGGKIEVETPADGGTRMVISLPTALAEIKRQQTNSGGRDWR